MDDLQEAWLGAWRFAARAHVGQTTPDEPLPYLLHVGSVAAEVLMAHHAQPFAQPALAVQCALLHDTLEDTAATEEQIATRFGAAVAAGVRALTKDASLPKPEAMADSLARIRAQPREVWAVKLADRITNLQPPPSSWKPEKIVAYRGEAERILAALADGHAGLAGRLARKIAAYPPARVE